MKREQAGTYLSAVFVDYDNIYLSLKRKSEDAAKRFAKDAGRWLKQLETGGLITATNGQLLQGRRRIVMNRCYGNPVPKRNASDNSTDMSSFAFVRHHFLKAGFEIVDCPPLTAQLKNSSDIRMVMDLRDYLDHDTYFDEFIILSGDADFTPVLHRLRAHARRTVIYATDYTVTPYTAISDGEVREADLIALLADAQAVSHEPAAELTHAPSGNTLEVTRQAIVEDVIATARSSKAPVPLEVLADHAVRAIGHERTIGTAWAGAGGFRELLMQHLPSGMKVSGEPPYVVIDEQRHVAYQPAEMLPPRLEQEAHPERIQRAEPEGRPERIVRPQSEPDTFARGGLLRPQPTAGHLLPQGEPARQAPAQQPPTAPALPRRPAAHAEPAPRQPAPTVPAASQANRGNGADHTGAIQDSIARIHEACKAPPLAPPEYRALFEIIAKEITDNGLVGAQTIHNITQRARDRGIDVSRDDVRFVLEVVSEADPWFEQGASPTVFAGRFRNFVVARCRTQGLTLSADELDLVEAWFAGSTPAPSRQPTPAPNFAAQPPQRPAAPRQADSDLWATEEQQAQAQPRSRALAMSAADDHADMAEEDFPRIVRTRLRG
ncbi:MAG: NYN domain-containing protein [Hyphomicrobiaceae bacterium]